MLRPFDEKRLENLDPELSLYRLHTRALLRRYLSMSIELGRLPSLLGREFFRSKVSSYRVQTFEDVVILVLDVERCIQRLDPFSQRIIASVLLEERSFDETAVLLGCDRRTVTRRVPQAIDALTEVFMEAGLLKTKIRLEACQGGKTVELAASA